MERSSESPVSAVRAANYLNYFAAPTQPLKRKMFRPGSAPSPKGELKVNEPLAWRTQSSAKGTSAEFLPRILAVAQACPFGRRQSEGPGKELSKADELLR